MPKDDELRHGAPGETAVHLCVDMQRMFAERTEWKMPWLERVLPNIISIASAHFERKSAANASPRHQQMFGMFLILLVSFFAAGLLHAITGDVIFSAASASLGIMLLWAVLSILRD